jgi:hypothetical protein
MKKIYLSILTLATGLTAYGQNVIVPQTAGNNKSVSIPHHEATVRTPTDTCDLAQYASFGAGTIYSDGSGGYVFGTSGGQSKQSAQAYTMGFFNGYTQYSIEGVLVWAVRKNQTSTGSTLFAEIRAMDGTSTYGPTGTEFTITCPSTLLGTSPTITLAAVDTTNFTYLPIPSHVFVNQNYAVVIDYSDLVTKGDTIGFVCSGAGAAYSPNDALYLYHTASSDFWTTYNDVYTGLGDVMIAYWSVLDNAGLNVEDNMYGHGFKMSVYPNPASDNATISFAAENNANATVTVYNSAGKTMFTQTNSVAAGVVKNITVNTSNLAPGAYFVSVNEGDNRITKKLMVK